MRPSTRQIPNKCHMCFVLQSLIYVKLDIQYNQKITVYPLILFS